MDTEKKYIVKTFSTPQKFEDHANELWPDYRVHTVSQIGNFTTATFERADGK